MIGTTREYKYILKGKLPVPCEDIGEWGLFMGSPERIVKQEIIGGYFVSTVFLGIAHNFSDNFPPLLFETMIFDDSEMGADIPDSVLDYQERCSTWEEAEKQHQEAVEFTKKIITKA